MSVSNLLARAAPCARFVTFPRDER